MSSRGILAQSVCICICKHTGLIPHAWAIDELLGSYEAHC